jgi:hypothetical protein
VQLHEELVVVPAEHLLAAARATFQYLLTSFAFPDKALSSAPDYLLCI